MRDLLAILRFQAIGTKPSTPASSVADAPAFVPPIPLKFDLRELRRRLPLWGGLFLALAVPGVLLVLWKTGPSFLADSTLLVRQDPPSLAYTGERWRAKSIESFYDDYVRTLVCVAGERALYEETARRLEERGVEWIPAGVAPEEVPDHLRARMNVAHVRDSYIVRVGFEDRSADVPAPVVNAFVEVFLEALADEQHAEAREVLEILGVERERLVADIESNLDELRALSGQAGTAVLDEEQNVFYERLIRLQDGVTKVFVDRVRAEGRFEEGNAEAERLLAPLPEGELETLVDLDPAVTDARVMLQRMARDVAATTADLSPDHPERKQALERLDEARGRVARLEEETRGRLEARLRLERAERAEALIDRAKGGLDSARRSEKEMQAVVSDAEEGLLRYGEAVLLGNHLRARGERLQVALGRIDERIEELLVESKAPNRVTLRETARRPTRPASDRRMLFGAVAAIVAAVGSGVLAFWRELLETLRS